MIRTRKLPGVTRLAVLALALGALAGCSVLKAVGLASPPSMEMTELVPQDFELVVHVTDQLDPAADYTLTYRRSGRCDYKVEIRSPRRAVTEGAFEILDNQVAALWDAIRAAKYDVIQPRFPEEGLGPDKALGIQAYGVHANDFAKEVQAHCQKVPALEKIRGLALSYLPEKALRDTGPGPVAVGQSRQIVADTQTRLFYPADDPRLKDVPADRRQPFPSWYDAVNFGYSPAPGFTPWEKRE